MSWAMIRDKLARKAPGNRVIRSGSTTEDVDNESVEELSDTDQAIEAARVDGLEDAADHPERPVHTHNEYGHPDDLPEARVADRKKAS